MSLPLSFLFGTKTEGVGSLCLVELPIGGIVPRPWAGIIAESNLQCVSFLGFTSYVNLHFAHYLIVLH